MTGTGGSVPRMLRCFTNPRWLNLLDKTNGDRKMILFQFSKYGNRNSAVCLTLRLVLSSYPPEKLWKQIPLPTCGELQEQISNYLP
jgi:hypothetical protein